MDEKSRLAEAEAYIVRLEAERTALRTMIRTALRRWKRWTKTTDDTWDEPHAALEALDEAFSKKKAR